MLTLRWRSAVAASCCVPGIFSSFSLQSKDPRTGQIRPWNPTPQSCIDGSVDGDLPMAKLSQLFNVNHFIVSQVNAHITPCLKDEGRKSGNGNTVALSDHALLEYGLMTLGRCAHLARGEALHQLHMLSESGIVPNLFTKIRSVASQKYTGDITIFPKVSWTQVAGVLQNPTPDFVSQAVLYGEQATWPKLSQIHNHLAIELSLHDAIQELRTRVAFSQSQVDLRVIATSQLSRTGSEHGFRKRKRAGRKKHRASSQGWAELGPQAKHEDSLSLQYCEPGSTRM